MSCQLNSQCCHLCLIFCDTVSSELSRASRAPLTTRQRLASTDTAPSQISYESVGVRQSRHRVQHVAMTVKLTRSTECTLLHEWRDWPNDSVVYIGSSRFQWDGSSFLRAFPQWLTAAWPTIQKVSDRHRSNCHFPFCLYGTKSVNPCMQSRIERLIEFGMVLFTHARSVSKGSSHMMLNTWRVPPPLSLKFSVIDVISQSAHTAARLTPKTGPLIFRRQILA